MRSNVTKWIQVIDEEIDSRLDATGDLGAEGIRQQILSQDLVESGTMAGAVAKEFLLRREVRVGLPNLEAHESEESYPYLLNVGFIHQWAGPVGPFEFMEKGVDDAMPAIKKLWRKKIRARRR